MSLQFRICPKSYKQFQADSCVALNLRIDFKRFLFKQHHKVKRSVFSIILQKYIVQLVHYMQMKNKQSYFNE